MAQYLMLRFDELFLHNQMAMTREDASGTHPTQGKSFPKVGFDFAQPTFFARSKFMASYSRAYRSPSITSSSNIRSLIISI
jgi:hypothetical protein